MEEYETKPTLKQKKAVENIVKNNGNVSKSMREAGYAEASAKNPKVLTESKGFKQLCEEYIPDELILEALHDDITTKKGARVQELTLATKIKGMSIERHDVTSGGEKIVMLPSEVIDRLDT